MIGRFAATMKRYGITVAIADQHAIDPVREILAQHGIGLAEAPGGAPGKLETHLHAKAIITEGRFAMARNARVIGQLKAIRSKPAPGGGLSIWSPRRKGAHGDIASAVVLALFAAQRVGLSFKPSNSGRSYWSEEHTGGNAWRPQYESLGPGLVVNGGRWSY